MHYIVKHDKNTLNKKAELSQRWPCDAPYSICECPVSGVSNYAYSYISQKFKCVYPTPSL